MPIKPIDDVVRANGTCGQNRDRRVIRCRYDPDPLAEFGLVADHQIERITVHRQDHPIPARAIE
jgi:hypothetical protein